MKVKGACTDENMRDIQTEGGCCKHANPSIIRREGVFVLCLKKKARDSYTECLKVF